MNPLWRGGWAGRIRILSGLVLLAFAATHLANHALGLVSLEAMEAARAWRVAVTRSPAGTALLAAALAAHAGLALIALARMRSFRLPRLQAVQIVLGLSIPLVLLAHVVETRGAAEILGIRDGYPYVLWRLWRLPEAGLQILLMALVWLHGMIGLHLWLRGLAWWPRLIPAATALAVLVPALAVAGFLRAGADLAAATAKPGGEAALIAAVGWRTEAEAWIGQARRGAVAGYLGLVLAALIANTGWRIATLGRRIEVAFLDGPRVAGRRGMTVLEIAQANRVRIEAQCGGNGRCTTCRVIVLRGAEALPPPEATERETLRAIGAGEDTRLACQLRPQGNVTLARVHDGGRGAIRDRAGAGVERRMVILFLDMRGFTARTSGMLPHDVVHLLNRFFAAVVPAITAHSGRIDKYLGDGLLAVFDQPHDPPRAARAALEAVVDVDRALTRFNARLRGEGVEPVRIGIGLHMGDLVQGEIGAAGARQVTIIGDAVNTAARLEGVTKPLNAQVVVSRPVLDAAGVRLPDAAWQHLKLRGVHLEVEAVALRAASEILPWLASARGTA